MSPNILYPFINLRDFFAETVIEATHFDPGYSDHATDVWRVRTAEETVALRIFSQSFSGHFWDGLRYIFNWDVSSAAEVIERHDLLRDIGKLDTPHLLRSGTYGQYHYLMMEWMPGVRCSSFSDLSPAGLEAYGAHIARMHNHALPGPGKLTPIPSIIHFGEQFAAGLERLIDVYYLDQPEFRAAFTAQQACIRQLIPGAYCPIMIDIDPSQYLHNEQGELCALIDTDAYVSGPPELDLVHLEYLLTPGQAAWFARGYRRIRSLPDLSPVRHIYRLMSRILEVQGDPPLDEWLAQAPTFDKLPAVHHGSE